MVFRKYKKSRKSTRKPYSFTNSARNVVHGISNTVRKRYSGGRGIANLASDVMLLKTMVNAEKKRFDIPSQANPIGQLNGATGQAAYAFDVTPNPGQGTTSVTRTGNSIKLHAALYKFQFYHQSATAAPMKIKIMLLESKGSPVTAATTLANLFNLNPFVLNGVNPAIVDYNSDMNPDFMGQYKIIRQMKLTVPMDTYSGVSVIKDIDFGIRFAPNYHIRFAADGSSVVSSGQLTLVVLCDSGNVNAAVASTLTGAPVIAINTGCLMSYNLYNYFYDN